MKLKKENSENSRRKFMATLAASAGMAGLSAPLFANHLPGGSMEIKSTGESDEWMNNIKGSRRIVYDAPEPHLGLPFIWAWAYYLTNNQTGTADDDMTAMVVLRHNAIPFAMEDNLWSKYKFGESFKVTDNTTTEPAIRNPYYIPKDGDYPFPGVDGIKAMMDRGAMFCVCDLALSVYSGMIAQGMNLNPDEVNKEWKEGVLPGIQIVPSGVWALGRAQDNGCGYIYAGG